MAQHVSPVPTEYTPAGKRKGKKNVWTIVLVISVIVLVGSLGALGVIGYSYWQGQQKYEAVAEKANFDPSDAMAAGEEVELADITIDWDALLAINPDTVGWVYIPNSNINYPIVRGNDNDYYLTRDFEYQEGWAARYGSIFMDYRNNRDFSDPAIFIYGHHMNDGSMFADIAKMRDEQKFQECRTVYLLTPRGNYRLRSFSLIQCGPYDLLVKTVFTSPYDFTGYVQDKIDRAIVNVGEIPAAADINKFIALATCVGDWTDGRYILFCYIEATTVPGEHAVGEQGSELAVDAGTVSAIGDEAAYAIDPSANKKEQEQADEEQADEERVDEDE